MSDSFQKVQILHIPLDKIDLEDTRFKISRNNEDITSLALSIKETGLTSLPVVRPAKKQPGPGKARENYIIVCGFKRIESLVHNGYTGTVVCQTNVDATESFDAVRAVSDNAFGRQLTPAEIIKSIGLLSRFMDTALIAEKSLSIFNAQFNAGYIDDLQRVASLPLTLLNLIDGGRVSIKSAKKITTCTPDVVDCFISLFSAIKASKNKQMEIITNFLEIAAREKIDPAQLFQENNIQEILLYDSKDLGLKCNLLRNHLAKRRFPFLEKKRRDIQQKIGSLKFGTGIKFTVPENFEGMNYSLLLEFKTRDDFAARVESLERAVGNPAVQEILEK